MITKRTVKEFAAITLGTAIVAIAVYFFMMPSHVTVGSATALAMVLSNFIPLPVSVITLAMNLILLIIAFFLLGSEFGAKTVYCAVLLPAMLYVLERLLPGFQSLTQDPLLDVICYILIVGVGLAILTPNWMRYVLSEKTEHRFAAYGVNVWGLDASLPQRELAEKAIDMTREFFCSLGLPATLTEVGIDESKLELMAQKARGAGFDRTFVPLSVEDIHNILKMSL